MFLEAQTYVASKDYRKKKVGDQQYLLIGNKHNPQQDE